MAGAPSRNHNEQVLHIPVRINPRSIENKSFPLKNVPDLVGFYGINENREFEVFDEQLPYFHYPVKLPLDLNAGIEQAKRKLPDPPCYDVLNLCKYIYNHQYLLHTKKNGHLALGLDFVTLRGILRRIMCSPYEYKQDYRLLATRLNGTIYISKVETEAEEYDRINSSQSHINMCSWGFKFEQYCTSSSPDVRPDTSKPVNECSEFDCVFRTSVNDLNILFAAEMDGVCSSAILNLNDRELKDTVKFIELKTSTCDITPIQRRIFNERKSLQWWAQSFLVGVQTIVAGLRTREGLVTRIKNYQVNELPINKPWSTKVAAVFLELFLQELKLVMEHINDPYAVVQLDFLPRSSRITYKLLQGTDIPQVIPNWYRTFMRGNAKS